MTPRKRTRPDFTPGEWSSIVKLLRVTDDQEPWLREWLIELRKSAQLRAGDEAAYFKSAQAELEALRDVLVERVKVLASLEKRTDSAGYALELDALRTVTRDADRLRKAADEASRAIGRNPAHTPRKADHQRDVILELVQVYTTRTRERVSADSITEKHPFARLVSSVLGRNRVRDLICDALAHRPRATPHSKATSRPPLWRSKLFRESD